VLLRNTAIALQLKTICTDLIKFNLDNEVSQKLWEECTKVESEETHAQAAAWKDVQERYCHDIKAWRGQLLAEKYRQEANASRQTMERSLFEFTKTIRAQSTDNREIQKMQLSQSSQHHEAFMASQKEFMDLVKPMVEDAREGYLAARSPSVTLGRPMTPMTEGRATRRYSQSPLVTLGRPMTPMTEGRATRRHSPVKTMTEGKVTCDESAIKIEATSAEAMGHEVDIGITAVENMMEKTMLGPMKMGRCRPASDRASLVPGMDGDGNVLQHSATLLNKKQATEVLKKSQKTNAIASLKRNKMATRNMAQAQELKKRKADSKARAEANRKNRAFC